MGSKTTGTTKTSSKEVKAAKAKKVLSTDESRTRHVNKLREPLVDKAMEDNGLEPVKGESVADKAERLDAHYRNTIPTKNLAECDCGYGADAALPGCPFCGETEIIVKDKELFDEARGKTPAAIVPEVKAELVETGPPAERNASAEKLAALDVAVARVKEAHAQGIGSYWDLGTALRPIWEGQLYFQRLDASGAPKYKSWSQFLATEFGGQIADGHSYRVMDVARAFDRTTAIEIGVAKLSILVRAKNDAMPKLLEAAKTQTVKELAKTAAPFLHAPGTRTSASAVPERTGRGTSAGSRSARAEGRAQASFVAEKTAENRITVSTTLGAVEIPMFKRADMKARAKVLRDEPIGVEVYMNGVEARYFVDIGGDGGITLKIVRIRAKS